MKIINHEVNGLQISQRREDGYFNLSQMAKANGKLIADYLRLDTTKGFLEELSGSMGIPIDQIVIKIVKGKNHLRGTWGHPKVAIHLIYQNRCTVNYRFWLRKLVKVKLIFCACYLMMHWRM